MSLVPLGPDIAVWKGPHNITPAKCTHYTCNNVLLVFLLDMLGQGSLRFTVNL